MFVLNKIGARAFFLSFLACVDMVLMLPDLVPRENTQQWLRYLRHHTPTLPFRSAASNQRSNLSCATAPVLLRLLKAYKPSAAQSVTVGFPNVGKSNLINSLERSKVSPRLSHWHVVFVSKRSFLEGMRSCSTTWTYQGLANGPAGTWPQDH